MANEGYTLVQFYNASGGTLDLESSMDEFPYPRTIGNGDLAWFIHPSPDSTPSDFIVSYYSKEYQLGWIVCWDNPLNSKENKVLTSISAPSHALSDILSSMQTKLKNGTNVAENESTVSNNESTVSHGGYLAHASIGDGNFPVLQAVITKQKPNN